MGKEINETEKAPVDENKLIEKKEFIVEAYRSSFDKDLAYRKCGVTTEEALKLDTDISFQNRLNIILIKEQEKVLHNLRELMESPKDDVRLKATIALGRILYPSKFIEDNKKEQEPVRQDINVTVLNKVEMEVKKEEHAAEVLGILVESGAIKPRTVKSSESKIKQIRST